MRKWPRSLAVYFISVVFAIVSVYPIFWVVTVSMKSVKEYEMSPFGLPSSLRFENYARVLLDPRILRFMLNSLLVTCISVGLVLIFSLPSAYSLGRLRSKFSHAILIVFMLNFMMPVLVFMTPLFILVKKLGLLGSYWSIILPYSASRIGLSVFILRSFFRTIPSEVEDAAKVDGCGSFQTFLRICVPAVHGGILVVAIINFIAIWNEYFLALVIIQKQEMFTLPLGLMLFVYDYSANWPLMAVLLVMSVAPVLLLYAFFQESLVKGWGYVNK